MRTLTNTISGTLKTIGVSGLLIGTGLAMVSCGGSSDSANNGNADTTANTSTDISIESVQRAVLSDWVEFVVVPQHQAFANSINSLQQSLESCQSDGDWPKLTVEQAFLQSVEAWAHLQTINFGPVSDNSLDLKIQFWPVKNDLVPSRIMQLWEYDLEITKTVIDGSGAPIQGLPAVEYLLYSGESLYMENPSRWCDAASAITEYLVDASELILSEWAENYGQILVSDDASDLGFDDPQMILDQFFNSQLALLERVKNLKLADPIEDGDTEFQHSELSLLVIKNNIQLLADLFAGIDVDSTEVSGWQAYLNQFAQISDTATIDEAQSIGNEITVLYTQLLNDLDFIAGSLELAIADESQRPNLDALVTDLGVLIGIYKNQLRTSLGFFIGFNSDDGD